MKYNDFHFMSTFVHQEVEQISAYCLFLGLFINFKLISI